MTAAGTPADGVSKESLEARVAEIAAGYSPAAPDAAARALREVWMSFTPYGGVPLVKAAQLEQYEAAGIPIPVLKVLGTRLAREAGRDVAGYIPLTRLLWDAYGREGRVVALLALGAMELADPETVVPMLRDCCRTCVSWEDADRLAMDALEPIVREHPEEWLPRVAAWLDDESPWVRRAGVTAVGRLPMKRPELTGRCLALAEQLLLDRETDVRRAVSFAVRTCARADAPLVRGFLERHVPAAGPGAAWVLSDVVRSADRRVLPALLPLLPRYEAWLEDPALGAKERRSVESAVKTLRAAEG